MKKMTLGTRAAIAGGLLALAALAGCHKSARDEQPAETENMQGDAEPREVETPVAPPVIEKPVPEVVEAPAPANTAQAEEPPVAPDLQMQDDADATGMTARMPSTDASGDNSVEQQ